MSCVGMLTITRKGPGIFTKVDLRRFPSKKTILLMRFCAPSNGIPSGPNFANERRTGNSVARGEWRMERGDAQSRSILSEWPIPRPMRWRDDVNQVQSESEVDGIRASVKRGIPEGTDSWIENELRPLFVPPQLPISSRRDSSRQCGFGAGRPACLAARGLDPPTRKEALPTNRTFALSMIGVSRSQHAAICRCG